MDTARSKTSSLFNAIFDFGVIIKGIDGFAEFVAGVALLISPGLVHAVLTGIAGTASHGHSHVYHFIAQYVARLDGELAASGLTFLIVFLISHGVVKLALVYCLLRKIVRAYPIALAVLVGFLVYQVYVFARDPSIGMALFCMLDVVIVGLVWREYRVLLPKKVV